MHYICSELSDHIWHWGLDGLNCVGLDRKLKEMVALRACKWKKIVCTNKSVDSKGLKNYDKTYTMFIETLDFKNLWVIWIAYQQVKNDKGQG